jgi:DNA-binding winged helix-turn-helix (wHTH) protein
VNQSFPETKDYFETIWGRGYRLREPSEDKARGDQHQGTGEAA